MTRTGWFRVFLVVLALFIGFLIGQRSVQGRHPDTRRFVPIPTDIATLEAAAHARLEKEGDLGTKHHDPITSVPGLAEEMALIRAHHNAAPVHRPIPSPKAVATEKPKAVSRRPAERDVGQARRYRPRDSNRLTGKASWHATGRDSLYAAACFPLRAALGRGWRGRRVLVAYGRKAIEVVLNDFCASRDKTIDLSDEAFGYFAPLSRGVVKVVVEW